MVYWHALIFSKGCSSFINFILANKKYYLEIKNIYYLRTSPVTAISQAGLTYGKLVLIILTSTDTEKD